MALCFGAGLGLGEGSGLSAGPDLEASVYRFDKLCVYGECRVGTEFAFCLFVLTFCILCVVKLYCVFKVRMCHVFCVV